MTSGQDLHTTRRERDFFHRLLQLGERHAIEPLLKDALTHIVRMTGAERGYIELRSHPDDEQPEWTMGAHLSESEEADIRTRISTGIIARALAEGRTVSTDSAVHDDRFLDRDSVRDNRIQAVLCAPVGTRAPIGAIYLQGRLEPGPFTDSDRQYAELFARQLEICADRLLTERERKSQRDHTRDVRQRFRCPRIVGESAALDQALSRAEKVAGLDINLLLTGPTGTGKNLLARAIHDNSERTGEFIEVNCAAITENLAASEFFGAVKGSYTGADKDRVGKIQVAANGTLFLDEIAQLSPAVQAKLLQFLQSGEFAQVGAARNVRANNVRVICATNEDLDAAIRSGRFRRDLYHRICDFPIHMPGLDERRSDIPLLVEHFCADKCRQHKFVQLEVTRQALMAAREADWPGHIRELAAAVHTAVILAHGEGAEQLLERHLFPDDPGQRADNQPRTWKHALLHSKRRILGDALDRHGGNISRAARELGLQRTYVHRLLQELGLSRP